MSLIDELRAASPAIPPSHVPTAAELAGVVGGLVAIADRGKEDFVASLEDTDKFAALFTDGGPSGTESGGTAGNAPSVGADPNSGVVGGSGSSVTPAAPTPPDGPASGPGVVAPLDPANTPAPSGPASGPGVPDPVADPKLPGTDVPPVDAPTPPGPPVEVDDEGAEAELAQRESDLEAEVVTLRQQVANLKATQQLTQVGTDPSIPSTTG